MPPPPAGARCAQHPDQPAVDLCQRCGAFVCGECTEIRQEDVYCSRCAPLVDRPPSRWARGLGYVTTGWMAALSLAVVVMGQENRTLGALGLLVLFATPLEWLGGLVVLVAEAIAQRKPDAAPRTKRYLVVGAVALLLQLLTVSVFFSAVWIGLRGHEP